MMLAGKGSFHWRWPFAPSFLSVLFDMEFNFKHQRLESSQSFVKLILYLRGLNCSDFRGLTAEAAACKSCCCWTPKLMSSDPGCVIICDFLQNHVAILHLHFHTFILLCCSIHPLNRGVVGPRNRALPDSSLGSTSASFDHLDASFPHGPSPATLVFASLQSRLVSGIILGAGDRFAHSFQWQPSPPLLASSLFRDHSLLSSTTSTRTLSEITASLGRVNETNRRPP